MKILVLSNYYPPHWIGGYELGAAQAVKALRKLGHRVMVLTGGEHASCNPEDGVCRTLRLVDIYDALRLKEMSSDKRSQFEHDGRIYNKYNVEQLVIALQRFEPDVVYLWNLLGLGGLGLLACLGGLDIPWVWHLMDSVPTDQCLSWSAKTNVLMSNARYADLHAKFKGHYFVCSQRLADEIAARGVRLGGAVEVLPNWIQGRRVSHARGYLRDGRLRIVTAGQLVHEKGIGILIEAAALLRASGRDNFAVDIFGRVRDASFPQLVKNRNLEDKICFRGSVAQDDLSQAYAIQGYDVFAFPTWEREPFAFAPLEAMAAGCLVVMSDVCGNAEWFVHNVHCIKADRTPESFADAFARIIDGVTGIKDIAQRGQEVIWRDFHLDRIAARMEQRLSAAAAGPRTQLVMRDALDTTDSLLRYVA